MALLVGDPLPQPVPRLQKCEWETSRSLPTRRRCSGQESCRARPKWRPVGSPPAPTRLPRPGRPGRQPPGLASHAGLLPHEFSRRPVFSVTVGPLGGLQLHGRLIDATASFSLRMYLQGNVIK